MDIKYNDLLKEVLKRRFLKDHKKLIDFLGAIGFVSLMIGLQILCSIIK